MATKMATSVKEIDAAPQVVVSNAFLWSSWKWEVNSLATTIIASDSSLFSCDYQLIFIFFRCQLNLFTLKFLNQSSLVKALITILH